MLEMNHTVVHGDEPLMFQSEERGLSFTHEVALGGSPGATG